ncbi:MAG: L-histidine Nalpha-methyltransferase [Actinomycetota bacterium]|jgi:L-histidine N-alpha-methyltransferase|nr:L-histidine Nalpha-methyltransferase [Actinomycetota bacterium]
MTDDPTSTPRVDVHLTPDDLRAALRSDADRGLRSTPKDIPPKWFYDTRGSQLFDEITRLPEYYPTRRERAILVEHASEIAAITRADTLVELGSGTSEKTRILLDALRDAGTITRFVPFDVSEQTLRSAAEAVHHDYPSVAVHAVVGDFEHHLGSIPGGGRRLVAFLGGTIGNLLPPARAEFLLDIAKGLGLDDHLLLGLDLVKDVDRLEAAYDDAQGVTAEFNKNVLLVMNRELDADFDVTKFEHVAAYDRENSRIEMRLRAITTHTVEVRALGLAVPFAAGEEMRTEVSAKFTREQITEELEAAGMHLARWWTDPDGDFALLLARL